MSNEHDSCLGEHKSGNLSLGAVVDLTSLAGKQEGVAIQVAVNDFYARARIQQYPNLYVENSRGDPIRAGSSGPLEKYNARAIIGFGTWQEAVFVAQLGNESQIPIVSLANDHEVPLWASYQWPFLVNAARSQYAQMEAVAAIIQSWQWRKVNIIYEDFNPTAGGISPQLVAAIQAVDVEISDLLPLSPFTPYPFISENLKSLTLHGQCRVFIVHTSVSLGIKIFKEAKNLGMMGKDFVWITTNAITSQLDTLDASSIFTMQGVLGPIPEPTSSTLQAYDATWAVLRAILEGKPYWKSYKINSTGRFACIDEINGQHLLKSILQIKFEGLAGAFSFSEGNLAPVHFFKIVNVVGKSYRELGYWLEELGFSVSIHRAGSNNSMCSLGQVFWPGGPWSVPRGWAVATNASRLKIGVPADPTFSEFVNVTYDHSGGDPIISGFSIDVFKATIKHLPYDFPYDFTTGIKAYSGGRTPPL
ncbi:Glutamate receptor 2.1 [Morella rubra]|uniref:Glutamate receptor 2.1 n=1 Tax=Morella rubra TaxID=262757 RepID=A0A6A1W157_9ROSI|nr:Glutamate receptor 2.1 [Morella rubra]